MKVALLDDEPKATEMLSIEILKAMPEVEIIGVYKDPKTALSEIPKIKPDLLFLDIDMPIYNGFSFLEALPEMKLHVVFCTAYNQYALEAIKANALDYLLKPIDSMEVKAALNKAKEKIRTEEVYRIKDIIREIESKSPKKLHLPTAEGILFINPDDIIYCKAESNYVHVITTQHKHFVAKTLKYIEELLSSTHFSRVHNSYLVNINHLTKFVKADGGYLIMSNGDHVSVSKSRRLNFLS